ncbi:hypothetical protein GJAV_G00039880 [Gymnothorax javanicus]|nr:hypothetical protein GJAV_G00039880 [Gymnothorax javanicus]
MNLEDAELRFSLQQAPRPQYDLRFICSAEDFVNPQVTWAHNGTLLDSLPVLGISDLIEGRLGRSHAPPLQRSYGEQWRP